MSPFIITIASTGITALIGGVIGFLFWKIERKIDHMEQKSDKHNREQVEMRKRERELLLANANLVMVISRKVQGFDVNGDLVKAENELQQAQRDVQDFTRSVALERIEGERI